MEQNNEKSQEDKKKKNLEEKIKKDLTNFNLLNENIWIPLIDYKLNTNNPDMDIYQKLKRTGYINNEYKLQTHSILKTTFTQYVNLIENYDIVMSNKLLFSNISNRVNIQYKLQFLRKTLLKLLLYCMPIEKRNSIDLQHIDRMDNPNHNYIEAYQYIFDYLQFLESPDTIIWFFFHTPIYINMNIKGYRKVFEIMIDYAYQKWDIKNIYDDKINLYSKINYLNTYYYYLAYHGESNKQLISKFVKFNKKIYPNLNYLSKNIKLKNRPLLDSDYIELDKEILDNENSTSINIDDETVNKYLVNKRCKFYLKKNPKLEVLLIKYLDNKEKNQYKNQNNNLNYNGNQTIKFKNIKTDLSKNRILSKLSDKITNKIKICFITSKLLSINSVFRDRIGLIHNLDKNYFDVHLGVFDNEKEFQITKYTPIVQHFIRNYYINNKIIFLSDNLVNNQEKISECNFHIIYYPDLGMVLEQTLLSYAKLAPIQITTWGHSDTSGNCSIDYYITSKHFEKIEDISYIKNNYYESPILMNSLSTYYYSPRKLCKEHVNTNFESEFNTKVDYGFEENDILIGCLQSFFKIYEPFENILQNILLNTQNNVYILFSNSYPFNKCHLLRLQDKFKQNINRIKFYQNKNMIQWLNLVNICDFMIDPYPFGGCNTSLEAFDYDIPVVCYPSNMINGKFTEGFYKVMGIDLCIVNSEQEYYNCVKKLILDIDFLNNIKLMIKKNKHKLFEQKEVISEYEDLFVKLIDKHYVN
tara:strand:+ start:1857 stop:4118 length:2262 start_codon:yes stop_codon:yes gene_type:complete